MPLALGQSTKGSQSLGDGVDQPFLAGQVEEHKPDDRCRALVGAMDAAKSLHLLVGRPGELEGVEDSPLLILGSHVGMHADSGGAGSGDYDNVFASPLKKPRLVLVEFSPRHAVELAADIFVAFKAVRPPADFGDIADAEAGDEGIERIPWKI